MSPIIAALLALAGGAATGIGAQVLGWGTRPSVTCGCGHHRAFHGNGAGKCSETVQEESVWDRYGTPRGWQTVACQCQLFWPKRGAPGAAVTPAQVARKRGLDPDYAAFLEWLTRKGDQ